MNPKISILTPSFNHEKYVGFFIESVLKQSFEDFELIIVDDCSSDNNVNEIIKFKDLRIKLIQHPYNQGINATLNTAFENANGEYLVFCASDDMLTPNALEVIYKAFNEYPDVKAIYPRLVRIDKDNNKNKEKFANTKQKNREEYLYEIFMQGNCFTSPGMAMKGVDFRDILYPLDNAICNHQDTQMHIKILLNGEIKILDDILVLYRFDPETGNISSESPLTNNREAMETEILMDTFLEIKDINLLNTIFKKEINELQLGPYPETIEYFLGRMALCSRDEMRNIWGYHKIMRSCNTKSKMQILNQLYNFNFKALLDLIKQVVVNKNIFNRQYMRLQEKYHKYLRLKKIMIAMGGLNLVMLGIIFALILGERL